MKINAATYEGFEVISVIGQTPSGATKELSKPFEGDACLFILMLQGKGVHLEIEQGRRDNTEKIKFELKGISFIATIGV
jgi:hypothetical protein